MVEAGFASIDPRIDEIGSGNVGVLKVAGRRSGAKSEGMSCSFAESPVMNQPSICLSQELQAAVESLEERLKRYPDLKAKIEALLAVVENAAEDVDKANAAEQRMIEEIQQLGRAALQQWANPTRSAENGAVYPEYFCTHLLCFHTKPPTQ